MQPVKRPWLSLFSQTGSEIVGIYRNGMPMPNVIYTNNRIKSSWHNRLDYIDVEWNHNKDWIHKQLEMSIPQNPIVTLNGWLRIIPNHLCDKLEIYNVHPGDIIKYPELKGIDPQKKALELGLKTTGVVIHRVTSELDGGEIYKRMTCDIEKDDTELTLSNKLRDLSITMWTEFLKEKLW